MDKRLGGPAIRAYIATPAYDGKVDTDYAMSLAEACMVAAAMGIHCTVCTMKNGAFIDLARCNFVRLFLETDCTHLFFIDSDLKFEARAFVGLLTAGKPVCAGLYPRRQDKEDYPVRYVDAEEGGIQLIEGGWVECDRVPTGFLCIERSVIEEMAKDAPIIKQHGLPDVPRLFYTQHMSDGRYLGEDYAFCEDYVARYKKYIPVWPDFDFVHGGFEGNWHTFMNEQVEAFEENQKREVQNG